jgi:hypothetical protein
MTLMSNNAPRGHTIVFVSVALFALIVAGTYAIYFGGIQKFHLGGSDSWGQFGDYFGGLLNPIIGMATVLLVVRTLVATREEASATRAEMQRQLEFLMGEQKREDIRRKLNGVIEQWNAAMKLPAMTFMRGDSTTGESYLDSSQATYYHHLYSSTLINEYSAIAAGPEAHEVRVFLNRDLEQYIHLLRELNDYCLEYENEVGNRALTDYYRYRVQLPLRAMHAIGIVRQDVMNGLSVGLIFTDYAQN